MTTKQEQMKDEAKQEKNKQELDELLRRMLSTPPKPHVKPEKKKAGK